MSVVDDVLVPGADTPMPSTVSDLGRLYKSERPRLLRLAAMLVGDRATAEDVVQEAFVAVQRRWESLDDRMAGSAYLSACVANGARSVLRRRRVALRRLRVAEPEAGPSADVALLLHEEYRAVVAAVRRLPRRQQQVLVLRYWSGLTEAQIAETLGISPGAVKSNAARALMRVKRQLEAAQ
jgi:RNA polymerase sigma-70 factor (sigma-E family)